VVANNKVYVAYLITWTESEEGWGVRPDGASLHLTQDDANEYLNEYWAHMPVEVPTEYSRNDGVVGKLVAIGLNLYRRLNLSKKHGIRLWQVDLRNARAEGNITE